MKQRITDVEDEIARVEKQLIAAIQKRDRFENDDEKKWERYDADVQRLAKEKEQLRTEKEQLRDELKRKELAHEHTNAGQCMPLPPVPVVSSSCVPLLILL